MTLKFFDFFKTKTAARSDALLSLNASASAAYQAKEFEAAVRLYGALIEAHSDNAEPYYKRANALNALGKWREAIVDYDQAIALNANYANAYCNRSVALQRLGRLDEALASCDRAVAVNPADFLAHYNRAAVLKELGRLDEALAGYEASIALSSGYVEAHVNRGNLLRELNRHEAAVASFSRAIDLNPVFAPALHGRAHCLAELRRFNAALADYDRAIELDPGYADAFQGRLYSLVSLGLFKDAIAAYDRELSRDPNQKYLAGLRLHAGMQLCDWRGFASRMTRISEQIYLGNPVSPPFPLLSAIDSPELHRAAAELWVREQCPPDDALGAFPSRPPSEKIHIGYFSPDFRNHAVSQAAVEIFEMHDRARFEITGFAFGPRVADSMRARISRAFDRFLDVSDEPDIGVARLARKLGVDIAVDLGGYTEFCRTKIFAFRAAPVQVNYLGYPGTMAAPYMDYVISDRTVVPAELSTGYSEKLIYLPLSYIPHDSTSPIAETPCSRSLLGLPPEGFVFCCFNKKYKILPDMFECWMRILRRVPASVLWLSLDDGAAADNLRQRASELDIDPDRLIFADRMDSLSEHLARLRAADLFLDTFPYNAHATATDALWTGLPVLTLIGRSFAARVSASLLRSLRLEELVTSTLSEYENRAVELADKPLVLQGLKGRLTRDRVASGVFDTRLFTKNLEQAFAAIYAKNVAAIPPENIFVG